MKSKKEKYYFATSESELCYTLDWHIKEAERLELKTVKLFEAIPDNGSGYVWCQLFGEVTDRDECSKKCCNSYESNKSGRGTCINRGKTYIHGEVVEFDVKTGKEVTDEND